MTFTLDPLPYERNALEPVISGETLDYHYGRHHQAYVANLNNMLDGSGYENASLMEIVRGADGALFNNAAQVWNHTFYWNCLSPNGGGEPNGALSASIDTRYGSFRAFRDALTQSAVTNFGSGWTWLVKTEDGGLDIVNTSNAENPLRAGHSPLLTIDVWEHAYYIDYRNARPKYLEEIWKILNWDFVSANFA